METLTKILIKMRPLSTDGAILILVIKSIKMCHVSAPVLTVCCRYVDQTTGDRLTLREAARAGLLAMVGAPVAAIMEAMKARRSMSRSPSRERTLSPNSTLRSNFSSRDVSFDTDR